MAKSKVWGKVAYEKSWKISDTIGAKVNDYAEKAGSERFWPTTGDFPLEMDKCARILKSFTEQGVATTVEANDMADPDPAAKKKVRVLRKIPPKIIQEAKGLAIYTNFRTAIAPFGGSGGAGMVMARLPDGSWSAPSSISPNNYAAGLVYGVDIFDAVLIIRTQKALESFYTHKATLGADIGVVAGPLGAGAVAEVGTDRAPVFSYVKSRGVYAGISILGQVFVERFEENGAMYHWPGVKAQDILTGKVRVPREAGLLMTALQEAESGKAQAKNGDALDVVIPEGVDELELQEGEVLKLPPTPDMADPEAGDDDPEASRVRVQHQSLNMNDPALIAPQARPPPLPPRFVSQQSDLSIYSVEEPEPATRTAIPTSQVNNGNGLQAMDEGERREYEQYLESLQESEPLPSYRQTETVSAVVEENHPIQSGDAILPPALEENLQDLHLSSRQVDAQVTEDSKDIRHSFM